jgi:hypothetical protein
MSKQPEALRLACELHQDYESDLIDSAALELVRLNAVNAELLEASLNAADMLRDSRQVFVDLARIRGPRIDDAVAHGLVWIDEETWVDPDDAAVIRDHDRALSMLDAAIAKATGEQA